MPDMGATQTFAQISSSQTFSSPFGEEDLEEPPPVPTPQPPPPAPQAADSWDIPEEEPVGESLPGMTPPPQPAAADLAWGFGDDEEDPAESPLPPPVPQAPLQAEPPAPAMRDLPPPVPQPPASPIWEETTPPPVPQPPREEADALWSVPREEAPMDSDEPVVEQEPEPPMPSWEERSPLTEPEPPPAQEAEPPVVEVEEEEDLWSAPAPAQAFEPEAGPEAEEDVDVPVAFQAPEPEVAEDEPSGPSGFGWDAPEQEPAYEEVEESAPAAIPEPASEQPAFEEPPTPVAAPAVPEFQTPPGGEASSDAGLSPQEKALLLHRVEEKLSQGIREVLWEILPDLTERIIREEVAQIRKEISDTLTD